MTMDIQDADSVTVFTPIGRLDSNSSAGAEKQVTERIGAGAKRIVFDFSRLDYVSSAGLRVILMAAKQLRPLGGKLAICCMNAQIRDVFEMSGLLSLLVICDSRDAATSSVAD